MSELLVVHDIPGRLRLRLSPGVAAEGLADAVLQEPGVIGTTWSPRTRSLLVRYRPEATRPAAVADAVARLAGVEVGATVMGPPRDGVGGEPGAALAAGLAEAGRVLDDRVQRATRGTVGLAGLLPLALAGWAVAELVRGRTGPLAWSSALWYAHGLYRDYSVSVPSPPRD
jgi:hypothetical protein